MGGPDPENDPLHPRVHDAVERICAQAACDADTAFDLLMVEAAKLGQSLHLTALDVIDGVIRFDL